MSHLRRDRLASRFPVHVTLRVGERVWNLRSKRCFRELQRAFYAGAEREGFRLIHFSIQGNHMHFICEANDAAVLARGIQGLTVRMARGLNRVMQSTGRVFADRYHSRILRTPTQTRNAVHYVLNNYRKHSAQRGATLPRGWRDPFSSF